LLRHQLLSLKVTGHRLLVVAAGAQIDMLDEDLQSPILRLLINQHHPVKILVLDLKQVVQIIVIIIVEEQAVVSVRLINLHRVSQQDDSGQA
jgi:hypothetical protein